MTRKPRSAYPDKTRASRSARRQAILDAAAKRMGVESWSTLESVVRSVMEVSDTDEQAARRLRDLIRQLANTIKDGQPDEPPADMVEILEQYPLKSAGRPAQTKPANPPAP
jgi:hypothetical protein